MKSKILLKLKKDWMLYILLLPMVLWYITFAYKPMYGLLIAFKDFSLYKGVMDSPWIGLENFYNYITGPFFLRTLKNTLLISSYSLFIEFPIPIILALMLNEVKNSFAKKWIQTITYLPHFISIVVVAGIITNLLASNTGVINLILEKLGFEKTYFLIQPEYFRSIYISSGIWKEAGFSSIVYLAALSGIDPSLYEAAKIDGADRIKQMFYVTLPCILPTIVIMFIIKVGKILEVGYEKIILLYQPSTYETADVLSTYVYRAGLQEAQYGLATAAGLFNAIFGFLLVVGANKLARKLSQTSIW